ncbi:MAG: hypothetical protein AAB654_09625 [Acidobacteriota bacterium]
MAAVLLLKTTACRPARDPGLDAARKAFLGEAPPPPPGPVVTDLDIYIDASMSMRGFVQGAAANSSYRQILQHVLQTGTTGQYRMVRYKFSRTMDTVNQADPNQFLLPAFFDGTDTPLHSLLDRISQNPYAGHISVLVSDLVQSQTGTSQLALVESLLKVAATGLELRLIGVRSSFDGLYYIESFPQTGQSLALKLNQALPGGGRPFYLLVIAPDRPSMDRLDRYVLDKLSRPESFVPTETPAVVKDILPARTSSPPPWTRYSQRRGGQSPSGATTWYTTFHEVRPQGRESLLALQYLTQTTLPLDSPRKIGFEVRKCTFDGRRFTKPVSATIGVTVEKSGAGAGEGLQVSYRLPRPAPKVWEVYQVRMRPGEGNLAPPQWVRSWNTDSDQSPMVGNKTYQLALLVEAMVRAITEKNVFCEHYIAVRRGN